ncbi:MAG: crotonase/enoyl-CoA hydratase family protein [Rhodospirillaceae bacterium]
MTALLSRRMDHVLILTLNLPAKRNPITDPVLIDALEAALKEADRDLSIRSVILTGEGTAFSSGGDLDQMAVGKGLRDALPARTRENYRNGIQRLPLIFEALEVPVIAAVNGPAIGAGCDLACMCDIRIASDTARFAESFVRVGLIPGDGGAWLLPRIVGFAKASEMALTGETVNAQQALAWGLVTEVVAAEDLMDAALRKASLIAANPPHSVRMTKRLLRHAQSASLAASLELAAAMQAVSHATNDHDEALAATKEKRPGTYKAE